MNLNRRGMAIVTCLLIASFCIAVAHPRAASASAPDITAIDPESLTMQVGSTAEVTITSSDPIASPSDVVWTELGDVIEEVKTEVSGNTAVTTLRAAKFSPTPKEIKVAVSGSAPRTVTITTQTVVTAANFPAEPGQAFTINHDEGRTIQLLNLDNVRLTGEDLEVEVPSGGDSFVSALRSGTRINIRGLKPKTEPVRIEVKSNGQVVKTYDVTVKETLDRIEAEVTNIPMTEGQVYPLSQLNVKVVGKSEGVLNAQEEFKPQFSTTNSALAAVDPAQTTLTAVRAPRDDEEQPKLIVKAGAEDLIIPISIDPAARKINLTVQKNAVFVGKNETFGTQVQDTQGNPVPNPQIDWTIPLPEDQAALTIVNEQGTQVTVYGVQPKNGVRLVGTLTSPLPPPTVPPTPPPTVELVVNVRGTDVTGFAPLLIRLDLLDSQTAKDLFGKKAADEFFIAKVRLFNKLKNQNGEFGDSILVYSESLEIRVQLEMRDKDGSTDWTPVGTATYTSLFGQPAKFPNIPGDPKCEEVAHPNFDARYRPYTFDIVANTHDRRDERSVRTRILTVANGLSSLASFVTSIAVPPASNDTRLGLDQFKGLLIPSFEKLFPSLKEVQRQNIISMVMRPLEEIPFGSDVTRILFIPKGRLYGMIPKKIFRIGGVSTTGACAEVGIIKKAGSVQ